MRTVGNYGERKDLFIPKHETRQSSCSSRQVEPARLASRGEVSRAGAGSGAGNGAGVGNSAKTLKRLKKILQTTRL